MDSIKTHSVQKWYFLNTVLWCGLDDWVIDQINSEATRTLTPSIIDIIGSDFRHFSIAEWLSRQSKILSKIYIYSQENNWKSVIPPKIGEGPIKGRPYYCSLKKFICRRDTARRAVSVKCRTNNVSRIAFESSATGEWPSRSLKIIVNGTIQ